jgi:hypothetical protein
MAIEALTQEQGQDEPLPQADAPAPEPVEEADADEIALASAHAELAAEEEATAAADADKGEGDAPASTATPAAGVSRETPAADQVNVPKARLDQETGKRRTAEESAAYWQGKAEALEAVRTATGPAKEPPAPAKTPQEQVKDLRAAKLTSAKAYEDGEITLVEWTQKADEIEDQIAEIRANGVASFATEQATDPLRDPVVRQSTAALETDVEHYPVLAITKADGSRYYAPEELQALEPIARSEMKLDGRPFNPRDRDSLLELRTRVAELAEHNFGHRIPADVKAAALAARNPARAPAAQPAAKPAPTRPGVSPAQRAAKLDLAARMPPDLSKAGTAAGSRGPSESQILDLTSSDFESMTDEQIRALERQVA